MLAPSPAFQKALLSITKQHQDNPDSVVNYDDIDWDTLTPFFKLIFCLYMISTMGT